MHLKFSQPFLLINFGRFGVSASSFQKTTPVQEKWLKKQRTPININPSDDTA
jgi:hypothetical protein